MTTATRYFNGSTLLYRCEMRLYLAGNTKADMTGEWLPVTRTLRYRVNASKHECGTKCLNGSPRGTCECKCGGRNHGMGTPVARAEIAEFAEALLRNPNWVGSREHY
jgi:hypothetical protein